MRLGYFSSGISLDSDLYLNIRIQVTCSIGQLSMRLLRHLEYHLIDDLLDIEMTSSTNGNIHWLYWWGHDDTSHKLYFTQQHQGNEMLIDLKEIDKNK